MNNRHSVLPLTVDESIAGGEPSPADGEVMNGRMPEVVALFPKILSNESVDLRETNIVSRIGSVKRGRKEEGDDLSENSCPGRDDMTEAQQKAAAKKFAEAWRDKGREKGEGQPFWMSLLREVFGVESPEKSIQFEKPVRLDHVSAIDAFIPSTKVLIEQKSLGVDLKAPIRQSDGTSLTPFEQARRYANDLPHSEHPRWIVTCNFSEFHVYDMERPKDSAEVIFLRDLERDYYRLNFLVDAGDAHIKPELEISLKAGELVGKLYDALISQYRDPKDPDSLQSLNKLCVRLVFCLYAEDAGLFGKRSAFHDYIKSFDVAHVRNALIELFKILDTKVEDRDPYLDVRLAAFPYVNGGLFADESIEIPRFNQRIVDLLLSKCSEDFDWSGISPTIFGAVFESTLNPDTRRSGGMHYTSIENIHKVIDPLFLDDLKRELAKINRNKKELTEFQKKIASLKFLDPACGSGNFLTETYLSLRRLENEVLKLLIAEGQLAFGKSLSPIQVSIGQFYGIEINDFAVTVARTAMWISEAQMMRETEDIVQKELDFLPLRDDANIVEGNALRMDWADLHVERPIQKIYARKTNLILEQEAMVREPSPVYLKEVELHTNEILPPGARKSSPLTHYDYIISNPPFVGAMKMTQGQREDIARVFPKDKKTGELDYVSGWYAKAARLISETNTRCAFVSTNSICQGQQVASLWKYLFDSGIRIDFAWRTFRWDSESKDKARVHCVIVGFSKNNARSKKTIHFEDGKKTSAGNINGYLLDAENVAVESLSAPLCNVPPMRFGSMPRDKGNFCLSALERDALIEAEPLSAKWIRPYVGAEEFINNKKRWCLWLVDADPSELRRCPNVMRRIEAVRRLRAESRAPATRKFAETPTLFCQIAQPKTDYILIPGVSSEKRKYIPFGFMNKHAIASNAVFVIPDATLVHFGVLTSSAHMAWVRAVAGRLKSDYRYSRDIVYNTFPWPNPTPAQKQKIEETARGILDARNLYPDSSLADLYDELTMPMELRKAHQKNDAAVMAAYGFRKDMKEPKVVAELMRRYQEMVGNR